MNAQTDIELLLSIAKLLGYKYETKNIDFYNEGVYRVWQGITSPDGVFTAIGEGLTETGIWTRAIQFNYIPNWPENVDEALHECLSLASKNHWTLTIEPLDNLITVNFYKNFGYIDQKLIDFSDKYIPDYSTKDKALSLALSELLKSVLEDE